MPPTDFVLLDCAHTSMFTNNMFSSDSQSPTADAVPEQSAISQMKKKSKNIGNAKKTKGASRVLDLF